MEDYILSRLDVFYIQLMSFFEQFKYYYCIERLKVRKVRQAKSICDFEVDELHYVRINNASKVEFVENVHRSTLFPFFWAAIFLFALRLRYGVGEHQFILSEYCLKKPENAVRIVSPVVLFGLALIVAGIITLIYYYAK